MNVLAEAYEMGQVPAQPEAPMQAAQQPQDQGFMDRAKRVKNLNVTLVNVWKESDALGLTDVKKWLGMAIASLDKEFASDTIGSAVQKGKEKIQGWFK